MELRFTVWQFVRLMVHLEDAAAAADGPGRTRLYDGWKDVWTPLDQELAELAERDPDAYGAMMMDQDVVFENATAEQAAAAQAALEAVMDEMDAALSQGEAKGGDDGLLESLKFERRELRQLTRKLARQANQD